MKLFQAYTITAVLLFVLFLIPSFFGAYEWIFALIMTIGSLIADFICRKVRRWFEKREQNRK